MGEKSWDGPLFIVGLPRSGTKLLRTILNNHPQIHIPIVETGFLPLWIAEWGRHGDLSNYSYFQRFYKKSVRLPYFQSQRERGKLIDSRTWYESCQNYSVSAVFEALIRYDAERLKDKGVIWGDKSPSYVRHISSIARIFPGLRVIHIIRDVRDYCLSSHNAWGKNKVRAAQRWVDSIQTARQDALLLPSQYLEVRYEDILTDPPSEISRVCSFIGVDFYDSMVELNRPSENLGDTKNQSKIIKGNMRKYLDRMSTGDLYSIESIAGHLLEEMNYPSETSAPKKTVPPAMMRLYQGLDGINLLVFRTRERGLLTAIRRCMYGIALMAKMRSVKPQKKTTPS